MGASEATRSGRAAAAEGGGLVPSQTSQGSGPGVVFKPFGFVDHQARIARMRMALWGASAWFSQAQKGHRGMVAWMVTLTYSRADGWNPRHVSKAIESYRQWCRFRGIACRYAWVAEIQDGSKRADGVGRGAVHYHLVAWLPPGVSMPHWDRPQRISMRKREPLWAHGMSNVDQCRSGVAYLMKYASKGQNKDGFKFPKGLRVYGVGGLCEQGCDLRRWLGLPEWAKRLGGVGQLARAAGGVVVRETGELLVSPWVRERCQGGLRLSLARPMAERWFSGPYSLIGGVA